MTLEDTNIEPFENFETEETKPSQTAENFTTENIAEKLAKSQKHISISQFLEVNRQMLGFSTPSRNLFITVKEIVDNAIDAADDAGVLPFIEIKITRYKPKYYLLEIQDYGPGILKTKVPKVFGTLLYGSKFGKNEQRRGQQGLGVSAAVLSSQIDTGLPTTVISKCAGLPAYSQNIKIDVDKNSPIVTNVKKVDVPYESGVNIKIHVKGAYIKEGKRSIRYYLELINIINPYTKIILTEPDGETVQYLRSSDLVPPATTVSKIHPHTTQKGTFGRYISKATMTVYEYLLNEIHSSNELIANHVLQKVVIDSEMHCQALVYEQIQQIYETLQTMNFLVPEESLATIGEQQILNAMGYKDYQFAVSLTGDAKAFKNTIGKVQLVLLYDSNRLVKQDKIELIRAVNKTPLLLQQGACLITKAVAGINWKHYGLTQNKGELPCGPAKLFVHIAGLKIGFTSEAKEAIAENNELEQYLKNNLKRLGLKLSKMLKKQGYIQKQKQKALFLYENLPRFYELLSVSTNLPVVYSRILDAPVYFFKENDCVIMNYGTTSVNVELTFQNETVQRYRLKINQLIEREQVKSVFSDNLIYELPKTTDTTLSSISFTPSLTEDLYAKQLSILDKIELLTKDVVNQLETGNVPYLKIRVRNKNNLFLHEGGWWALGDKKSVKSMQKISGLVNLYQLIRLVFFIKMQIEKNKTSSLRECYYQSEQWGPFKFENQQQSDRMVETLETFLGCGREDFRIYPELRGQIAGPIIYEQKTKKGSKLVDCMLDIPDSGGGITIPYRVTDLKIVSCTAKFILAVETAGMFNRILENNFHQQYGCLLVCLVGQPVRAVKQLMLLLNTGDTLNVRSSLPIFTFLDCDGWSFQIHGSIKYGAAKTAHISYKLATPKTIHLGLKFEDVLNYKLPTDKLTSEDVHCFERLLTDPRFTEPEWNTSINVQLAEKKKCEQQSLAAKDIDFVTDVYLPTKLEQYGFYRLDGH